MVRRTDWKLWLGISISLLCLALLFRKMELAKLAVAFREMDWRFLVPAVAVTFISYACRAVRWHILLLPMQRIGFGPLYSATLIGYMANNILPARLGELARAWVLGVRQGLGTSAVFATLVVDRLWDGFTVLLILVITVFTVQLPPDMAGVQGAMVSGGYVTLVLYLGVMSFLVLLKRNTRQTIGVVKALLRPLPDQFGVRLTTLLDSFICGIRLGGRPLEMTGLACSSVIVWAFALWGVDLVLRSFGILMPLPGTMLIMVFLVFAVMVPAAPGFIGTYHFACVTALKAFSIPAEKAMSVALVMHGINFFPVIAAGFWCLWRGKISLRQIQATASAEEV